MVGDSDTDALSSKKSRIAGSAEEWTNVKMRWVEVALSQNIERVIFCLNFIRQQLDIRSGPE